MDRQLFADYSIFEFDDCLMTEASLSVIFLELFELRYFLNSPSIYLVSIG